MVKDTYCKVKLYQEYLNAIYDLKKKITSKTINLYEQNLACHQTVLSFLNIQISNPNHMCRKMVKQVVEYCNCGFYVSKKIVTWEIQ